MVLRDPVRVDDLLDHIGEHIDRVEVEIRRRIQLTQITHVISKNVDAITELLRGLVETAWLERILTLSQVRKRINSMLFSSWAGQRIPVISIGTLEHGDDRADFPY